MSLRGESDKKGLPEVRSIADSVQWNALIGGMSNFNVFAFWEWGVFKSPSWQPRRLAVFEKDQCIGAAQILIKTKAGCHFGWCPSGINLISYEKLQNVVTALADYFEEQRYVFRFNFLDSRGGIEQFLTDECRRLKLVAHPINSGYTVRHILPDTGDLLPSFSSNHRYYLKKALAQNLNFRIAEPPNIDDFLILYSQMMALKNKPELAINRTALETLVQAYNGKVLAASVHKDGNPLSSCLVLHSNGNAFYFLAAANEEGRKFYASYLMINELFEYLRSRQIFSFDFGGITPFKPDARGVNRFKMGFNGKVVAYIGERDLASHESLRAAFGLAVKFFNLA